MNIDYNSEESYNVSFRGSNATIESILSLKTFDFQNTTPGRFRIYEDIDWNHAILGAFLDVLYFFKERGIQWEKFKLTFYGRHQSFTSVLLQTVNGLNIFKKMGLKLSFKDDDEYSADCEYLFPGINQNKQLESLEVDIYGTNRDRFEDDFTTLALREMTTLKELELWGMVHFDDQLFCESIGENESLEILHLGFRHCNGIADEGISNIVTSLASHPKLEDLSIVTDDQFGELSSKAIEGLLSETQTLSMLVLINGGNERGLNTECIVKGLKKNQSLTSLQTSNSLYGDLILSRFFQILHHCPKLENLQFWEKDITASDLEQVIHMGRLQKPIMLYLRNRVIRKNIGVMTKLLRCHPEVRLKVPRPDKAFDGNVELKHICKLNWCGRYLIDSSTTSVPLSLWPVVFENVNKGEDFTNNDDKPSVIYDFLKGPAFAARNK